LAFSKELALLELGEFLERHSSVIVKAWDRIQTVRDLRAKVGRGASLYRSPSAAALPPRPVAATVAVAGRSRCVVRVGAWNPTDDEFKRALALVPPERREKVLKFKFESDQRLHLCGRLLLRRLIHQHLGIAYSDISFAYTKGNKPVLGSPVPPGCAFPNFNFNYSHEGELVVGACEPSCIVGVDVAKIEMRGKSRSVEDHFDTMRKCFSSREWALIRGGLDDRDRLYRFFVFWALKESYVKATGWGLGTEFDTIEFRDVSFDGAIEDNKRIAIAVDGRLQGDWFFRVRLLDVDHVMAVATGPPSDAAPTFKATFRMPAADPAWRHSAPIDCDIQYLTVPELIEGMPPWKD
jgi:4'-phosphopantetheinyl transferase